MKLNLSCHEINQIKKVFYDNGYNCLKMDHGNICHEVKFLALHLNQSGLINLTILILRWGLCKFKYFE